MELTTEQFLSERLSVIDAQMKALREEKAKLKQAIDLFKDDKTQKSGHRQTINGEPIFKEKIKTTLTEKYPNGATANDILAYVNERWEREIIRSSLSPQLSRLKKEGVITLDNDVWKLAKNESTPIVGADDNATTLSNSNQNLLQDMIE